MNEILISRRAAIDAVNECSKWYQSMFHETRPTIDSIIDRLMSLPTAEQSSGLYECFHCLSRSVVWSCDYDAEDVGYDRPGIVHQCHCENCGADIEYFVPIEEDIPIEYFESGGK